MNSSRVLLLLLLSACGGCVAWERHAKPPTDLPSTEVPTIHPKVFTLIEGWVSDTAQPVATEINLDAMRINRNQFDFATVAKEDEWISCPGEGEGSRTFLRYRLLWKEDNLYRIEFQNNGGGTLTTSRTITFEIHHRDLVTGGKKSKAMVLRVKSIE